jgi:maleylpyruvate isomerase
MTQESLPMMTLHNYWRSSTSYRTRIVLNLKGLDYTYAAYHLRKGEQRGETYLRLNRQGLVPSLELDDGHVLTQSLAIIDYLDEVRPEPPLLPADPLDRARVRAIAHAIALDLHPINNLRILSYLKVNFGQDDEGVARWFRHWVGECFGPLEADLARHPDTGTYCHGEAPTLADVCLVPQVANGGRFNVDMTPYPTINRIYDACMKIDAFARAAPAAQPDAE